jgi:hypothetical protein
MGTATLFTVFNLSEISHGKEMAFRLKWGSVMSSPYIRCAVSYEDSIAKPTEEIVTNQS